MFEPDLTSYPWGPQLTDASRIGAEEVVRVARGVRASLEIAAADELGLQFAELLNVRVDPPGRRGALAAAAAIFAGARTIARVGEILRQDLNAATWKIDGGLTVLERNRGNEALVQLMLCAHEAHEVAVLQRARAVVRGYPRALGDTLDVGSADVPLEDLRRYLSLRLEQAMVQGTRFRFDQLTAALSSRARPAMEGVVWASYEGRRPAKVFIVDREADGMLDIEYADVVLAKGTRIGVVHPIELPSDVRDRWGAMLADLEFVADFPQLDRQCLRAEADFPYTEVGAIAEHWELVRFLYQRGWTRDAESRDFEFALRGSKLWLQTKLEPQADSRLLEHFGLQRPEIDEPGLEQHIVHSEAAAECIEVLERFAPNVLYG